MGKETVTTERMLLSGQRSSHVSCKTLASDPLALMGAILSITPKDSSAPFHCLRATYFPEEGKFRFSVRLKGEAVQVFIGAYNDGEFLGDYDVADFEREVITWICSGGLPEMVSVISGMYRAHTEARYQEA